MRLVLNIVVIFALSFLASCGFKPANGTASSFNTTGFMPAISLPQPQTKAEYALKNEFQRRLSGDQGAYRLTWRYNNSLTGSSLNTNNDYERYNNRYTLSWQLYDSNNRRVKSGTSRTNIGINIAKTGYPTIAAQQDADRQAAKILSQDVYSQLRAYFRQYK
ncbi:MAG: LPS assembly lipoprotein LptE [Alphaproteobacteria bacterium]